MLSTDFCHTRLESMVAYLILAGLQVMISRSFRKHGSVLHQVPMKFITFGEIVSDMPLHSIPDIFSQVILVHGVSTLLDQYLGTMRWSETSQISQSLFRNNNLNRVFIIVDMRAHRNNGRNLSFLRDGWRHEKRKIAVTGKLTTTPDSIDGLGTKNVR